MFGLRLVLQVLEQMRQLNEDAVHEVEQINQRIANIEARLFARTEELAKTGALLGGGLVGKNAADELTIELEDEKRDQDNRWGCPSLFTWSC